MAQAPVCRWLPTINQTARQGGVQGLRAGNCAPLRQRAWLQGLAAPLGGRANIRLDDTLAQAGARLRGASGRVVGHDPFRNGRLAPAPDRPRLTILKRTLSKSGSAARLKSITRHCGEARSVSRKPVAGHHVKTLSPAVPALGAQPAGVLFRHLSASNRRITPRDHKSVMQDISWRTDRGFASAAKASLPYPRVSASAA